MDRDEVDNRLDEHAEHLALRVVEHAREDLGHFLQVRLTARTQHRYSQTTKLLNAGGRRPHSTTNRTMHLYSQTDAVNRRRRRAAHNAPITD